jgi:regulator of replication initiation timing
MSVEVYRLYLDLEKRISELEREVAELRNEKSVISEEEQRLIDEADAYNRVLKEKYGKKFKHDPEGFYNQYCVRKTR